VKTLFLGGIKSGKSTLAEKYTLKLAQKKPYYLATTQFFDEEMKLKVEEHKRQRSDKFHTIEEPLELTKTLTKLQGECVLVECVSMWLNNMLHHKHTHKQILQEIDSLCALDVDMVFVLNDVSCSVVSEYKLVREFVNLSGIISQKLAKHCEEVYHVSAGIGVQIK
jgi:adenosylcobinamide kinase/adenosylcobinamide-phosphate guanylyltransferase